MGITTPSTNLKGFSPDFLRLGGRLCHGSFLWCSSPWFGWDHEISPGRQGAWPGELLLLVLRILFKIVCNYFEYKHIYQTKWYGYVSIQKQDIVMDALEFTYHTKITSKCFVPLYADKPSFGDGTTSASFFYGTGTLIPGSGNVTTAAPFRCVGHNTVRCENIPGCCHGIQATMGFYTYSLSDYHMDD